MKNFKRILDKTGVYRYYVNGKQITSKKGASEYVKRNFKTLKIDQLSKQERQSYQGRINAQKGAKAASKRAKETYRYKGKFLDPALNSFLKTLKIPEKNINKKFPDAKDYGEFLKALSKKYASNLSSFELDKQSEWGLTNFKRNRSTFENTAAIVEALEKEFKGYSIHVIAADATGADFQPPKGKFKKSPLKKYKPGSLITSKLKAIEYIKDWENYQAALRDDKGKSAAYMRILYNPKLDIVNKILTFNLFDYKKAKEEKKALPKEIEEEEENFFDIDEEFS